MPFRTSRRVEFVDTDTANIVHFSNFFRFMESAECEFLRHHGLSVVMTWQGQAIGFPRRAASCEYLKPARFEDVLDIVVTVLKIGHSSVTYGHEFFLRGELIARGQVSTVCCRVLDDRRIEPIAIPAEIRRVLEEAAG
ncbi:MAG: acyl-CoA thioesterase [Gemmataceae bacterium]|nr:acyl-CoA thioesterase [Gemmataceae bacterium]MDW8267116.1 thioesterase family protein [Gemmataceae bacterium]